MRYKYPVTTLPTLSPSFDWRAEGIDWPVTTEVGRGPLRSRRHDHRGHVARPGERQPDLPWRTRRDPRRQQQLRGGRLASHHRIACRDAIRPRIPPFAANSVPAASCPPMSSRLIRDLDPADPPDQAAASGNFGPRLPRTLGRRRPFRRSTLARAADRRPGRRGRRRDRRSPRRSSLTGPQAGRQPCRSRS